MDERQIEQIGFPGSRANFARSPGMFSDGDTEISKDMLCKREQVGFLQRNRNSLQDGREHPVPCGDGDLLFLDALPLLRSVALQLLGNLQMPLRNL
jgi:hypothetical protein